MDGREEAGGGTWMAGRRRDEALGAAWWQGGAGRGGGGVGKASAGVGTGRERRGEGRPALGMEEMADPFCAGSVLIKVTAARGRNGRSPLFFPRTKTTTNVFQQVACIS